MKETFGQYLARVRKHHHYSQRRLAAAVGVDHTYLSKIENGHLPPPSPETVFKIAIELGENYWHLFEAAGMCTHCYGTGKTKEAQNA